MAISFSHIARHWRYAAFSMLLLWAAGLPLGGSLANSGQDALSGPIRVIDGDTFVISGIKVRLHGIDAPESDQICVTEQGLDWACGGWITKVATDRYAGQSARCDVVDTDRYGRSVARCVALGEDVGSWLVREGMAFAYVKYSADYVQAEREAARMDRGLHAVRLQSPAQHRATRAKGRIPPDDACKIKGNISADGKQIYHQPGQQFYERTGINENKGERWFCSAAAAQAAGWRASRR